MYRMKSLWSVLAFKTSRISESSQEIQMQLLEYGQIYFQDISGVISEIV